MHDTKKTAPRGMYLAPFDAIWPPILLMALAAIVGLIAAYFNVISLVVLAAIGITILIGDCFGRSKDYLNAQRRFRNARDGAERVEVLRRFRRAWCARVACNAAWQRHCDAGKPEQNLHKNFVSQAYHAIGYRWYHIFPDGTFTRHSPFLKLAFWIHLFTGKMKRDSTEHTKPSLEPAE